jgi:hypothetical protein
MSDLAMFARKLCDSRHSGRRYYWNFPLTRELEHPAIAPGVRRHRRGQRRPLTSLTAATETKSAVKGVQRGVCVRVA